MESFESNFTQVLKCFYCHLATKLCFTKCCSLGFIYSMDSSNDIFLYTNVNFFKVSHFQIQSLQKHNVSTSQVCHLYHSTPLNRKTISLHHKLHNFHTSIFPMPFIKFSFWANNKLPQGCGTFIKHFARSTCLIFVLITYL